MRRRLRSKTSAAHSVRSQPCAGLPEPLAEPEDGAARKSVYLVTLPHPRRVHSAGGLPLIAPETLCRADILVRLRQACEHPEYKDAKSIAQGSAVSLKLASVWLEAHAAGEDAAVHGHYHIALLAEGPFRFLPVKRSLLANGRLASHWSASHDGYWSAIRYVAMPSPSKPLACLDKAPLLWAAVGSHPDVEACCHEPATAAAVAGKRRRAQERAAEQGKGEPRINEFDLWPIIVQAGIRNTDDNRTGHLQLMQYVKCNCSMAVCAFVFKIRARLNALIDDVWQWDQVNEVLAVAKQTRFESLDMATRLPCVCKGAWAAFAVASLIANGVSVQELCSDVYNALVSGRGETTRVIVLAGASGGEGKSFFLKGLASVFQAGEIFHSPARGSFPLLGIENAKVVALDDWRFTEDVLPFSVQCLWYDGSPLPVARPQNHTASMGHLLYRGSAPIFATTKLQDIERLRLASQPDRWSGYPGDGNASMILRRLKVYQFPHRVAAPSMQVPCCPHCFAQLVLAQAPLRPPPGSVLP